MLRALCRRLALTAALVGLLSVSFSSLAPPAWAKSPTTSPCVKYDSDPYLHCYVSIDDIAPSGSNLGISANMEIFTPTVASGDLESLDQMVIFGCPSSCTQSEPFDIEVGWIVAPNQTWTYPDGTAGSDLYTHLFVFVRDTDKAAPDNACLVHWTPAGWTCGWNSNYPNGSPDYPGEVLSITNPSTASQVTVGHFVIVYSNGSWWIQYNGNWIGNIDGRWFNGLFNSVAEAQWGGEVALHSNRPTTQMGNGTCGTVTNTNTMFSAHMYNMLFAESGYTVPALDNSLKSIQSVSAHYKGSFYSTTDPTYGQPVSNLSYGGPTDCR